MSESKRRKKEIEHLKRSENAWLAALTPEERTAALVAERTHAQLVERKGLVGGCYLLAFFLNEFLHSQHAIQTDLVVGWVNDGTWPGVTSHAWIELSGKKIDISLTRTEFPESQPPGDLIILDRIQRRGAAQYNYHREPPPEALRFVEQAVKDGAIPLGPLEEKTREHAYVLGLSKSREGILTYFSRNPLDRSFAELRRLVL